MIDKEVCVCVCVCKVVPRHKVSGVVGVWEEGASEFVDS